jgi:tetratricopeptide (TPR) repeat protein
VAPTWLVQLPWLTSEEDRATLQRELAGVGQERMLREMGELLDRYTQQRPLLIVTEDLHWADHATVRLIEHVARRRGPAQLMWLGSFRPADVVASDHPIKGVRQELRAHRLSDEIVLDPFSERDVADYLGSRFPDAKASEAFVRLLHAHTDGLPLFVVNVIDDLLSEGAIGDGSLSEGALDGPWRVPESLAGVIEKQVERLPGELRYLLTAASVAGVEFRPETVADIISKEPAWVHEQCDKLARRYAWLQLVAAGRLADGALDARYAFRHALYHHVLYQRMTEATRVEMHLLAGRSMERRRAERAATSAELATHYERGRDMRAALRHYADATANAIRSFAPTEATQLTEHALTLVPCCPDGVERQELELALVAQRGVAFSQLHGVASPTSTQAFERARTLLDALPPTPGRAWVLSGLAWIYYVRGEFAAARGVAERIHALAQAHDDHVLFAAACNLLGVTLGYHSDLHIAREWLERGIAACLELGDRLPFSLFVVDPEVSMRANLCLPLVSMGLADGAREHMAAAIARADRIGQPMAQMLAHWCACMVEIRLDHPERVRALATELQRIVSAHGVAQGEGPALWYAGWAQARLGDPEGGHRRILEGFERHARFGMYAGCPQVLSYAAQARLLAGDPKGADAHIDEGLALARRMGETVALSDLFLQRGRVALARGDADAARAAWRDAVSEARLHGAQGFEVEALTRLCGLPGASGDDARALEALCAALPEGFDATLAGSAASALDRA